MAKARQYSLAPTQAYAPASAAPASRVGAARLPTPPARGKRALAAAPPSARGHGRCASQAGSVFCETAAPLTRHAVAATRVGGRRIGGVEQLCSVCGVVILPTQPRHPTMRAHSECALLRRQMLRFSKKSKKVNQLFIFITYTFLILVLLTMFIFRMFYFYVN